jgi:hypothetical protein
MNKNKEEEDEEKMVATEEWHRSGGEHLVVASRSGGRHRSLGVRFVPNFKNSRPVLSGN